MNIIEAIVEHVEGPELRWTGRQIARAERLVPSEDWCSPSFDGLSRDLKAQPTRLTLLISTPRSGSTFVCDQLRQRTGLLCHEYLQPYEYLPLLASRWDCLDAKGQLLPLEYIRSLESARARGENLAINVHVSHLRVLAALAPFLSTRYRNIDVIFLKRQDLVAQAVSWELASQTNQWTHAFARQARPKYRADRLHRRVATLAAQNALVDRILDQTTVMPVVATYEELASNVNLLDELLKNVPLNYPNDQHSRATEEPDVPTIRRQDDPLKEAWAQRLRRDLGVA